MSGAKLSPLALRVLDAVLPIRPPWLLAGRTALWKLLPERGLLTNLDLVWHGTAQLGSLGQEVRCRLAEAHLEVTTIRSGASVLRLLVEGGLETCTLTLTAEPEPPLAPPSRAALEGLSFDVASSHQVLVDSLCALLEGPDPMGLSDVRTLMKNGASLEKALVDSPRKIRGFSPLDLAWSLQAFRIQSLGFKTEEAESLMRFKGQLVLQILAVCFPSPLVS